MQNPSSPAYTSLPLDNTVTTPVLYIYQILPVLYKIYTSGKWLGNLKELIIGLKEDIPNASIVPYFGQRRAICKKSCVNGKCNLCSQIIQLANSLQENGLEVRND